MYHSCATSSKLYEAIHTRSSAMRGKSHFWNLGGRSGSRGPSGRPPALLSDDEADCSFIAATSALMDVSSVVRDFSVSITSAMVGSLMAAECGGEVEEDCGDGEELGLWAAAVEDWVERVGDDRRDRDTRLSRAAMPRVAGPRLRSS
ncbi:hypothetical protein BS78_08G019500 [Paspalum vaginatum]|nr:hypothetical protein BS78_08G019500 [Paspalum vaginatum]